MTSLKSALLIHYYFPPIHSIGVLRNFHLAQAFKKEIQNIQVLTTSNRKVLPQNNLQGQEEFKVVELETKDYRTKAGKTHFQESEKEKPFANFARKLIDSYPFNIWIGEGGSTYIKNGIKHGAAFLTKNPEALIYTSFRPYSDLYIGYQLKQKFPKAKWVVDFRDLHVDPMYKNVFLPSYQKRNNHKILQEADLIISVSEGLSKTLGVSYGQVKTIYNGIVPREDQVEKFEKFTISYTGSMFGDKRNPEPFFKWLTQLIKNEIIDLEDLAIKYAGKDGIRFERYIEKFKLSSSFENLGMISHHKAKNLQKKSHVNLLLSSVTKNHKGILTGKLFEYIGSLTPTVAVITGGEDQEMEKILHDAQAGIMFYESKNEGDKFLSWYNNWKKGEHTMNDAERIEKRFSWDYAAQQIIAELNV